MRAAGRILMTLVVAALAAGNVAHAGMVVIATTAPDIALSDEFEPGDALNLPEGAEVTLLSVDGTVQTVRGPGGVAGIDRASTRDDGVIDTGRGCRYRSGIDAG